MDKDAAAYKVSITEAGKELMTELASFCYANKTTMPSDYNQTLMNINEGKRQVYIKIMRMIEKGKNGLDN